MQNRFPFQPVRFLQVNSKEATDVLGPLAGLQGTWANAQETMGWNVIAVPGFAEGVPVNDGFVLEVIPYTETLSFQPVVVADNRGPAINNLQEVQQIGGLIYEQKIVSNCSTDFCSQRGFAKGTVIHMETGMFLNMTNFHAGTPIARMSTIPHGNSLLALGTTANGIGAAPVIPDNSIAPFPVTGTTPFGYGEDQYLNQQFKAFEQSNPNSALKLMNNGKNFGNVTTLSLTTRNTSGGILNIPFIQNHVNATNMDCTFWIADVVDANENTTKQLQYSQTIDLVFPASTDKTKRLFVWPHVDVNTLVLQS